MTQQPGLIWLKGPGGDRETGCLREVWGRLGWVRLPKVLLASAWETNSLQHKLEQ